MKYIGKSTKRWIVTRKKWLKENPPNHEGYYICGICKRMVHYSEITLDHVIPRSRRPDLRYEPTNLQPAHWVCNSKKGSTDGTDPWTKESQIID